MISTLLGQFSNLLGNLGSSTGSSVIDATSNLPAESVGFLGDVAGTFGS